MHITEFTRRILDLLSNIGKPYIVGGAVRDYVLNTESKDVDIEVFGVSLEEILAKLSDFPTDIIGKSFGVIEYTNGTEKINVSVPRVEIASDIMQWEFIFPYDISLYNAAQRRDYTANSLYWDYENNSLIDMFDGVKDIESKTLRVVNRLTFVEDPLRVLRGMSMSSRFGFSADDRTNDIFSRMLHYYPFIPVERIWTEWEKWSRGPYSWKILQFLQNSMWILWYPQITMLQNLEQDPIYHPEGTVFTHTMLALKEAHSANHHESLLAFAILCHDFGKAATTVYGKRISSPDHAFASSRMAYRFMNDINAPHDLRDAVVELCRYHMFPIDKYTVSQLRHLISDLKHNSFDDLYDLILADRNGRNLPLVTRDDFPNLNNDLRTVNTIPLLMGRHLIEAGMKPSREFGEILKLALSEQLDGKFDSIEGAREWLQSYMNQMETIN